MKPRAMVQHIHQEINGIMFANELELPWIIESWIEIVISLKVKLLVNILSQKCSKKKNGENKTRLPVEEFEGAKR
jgi:hypothetical protein